MPLHLLGKKSWNPYAPAAVERVRADEAAAAAREEAEEQRQLEHDAERRLALLRGEEAPPPIRPASDDEQCDKARGEKRRRDGGGGREDRRKMRRLAGEDDTDRDIRLAREDGTREPKREVVLHDAGKKKGNDAPIVDHAGHIQLFAPKQRTVVEKNADAEAERKREEQELEDQYTMRFSNAAGFKKGVKDAPWYVARRGYSGTEALDEPEKFIESMGTDAFGNEDPGRHRRNTARINKADPMAAMKQAQVKLKDVDRKREEWKKEREREMRKMIIEQEEQLEREKRRQRRRKKEDEDLEGFSLDHPADTSQRYDKHRFHERSTDATRGHKHGYGHHRKNHKHEWHRERDHVSKDRNTARGRSHISRHRSSHDSKRTTSTVIP